MDKEKTVGYWLKEAKDDVPVAEHLFVSGDYLYCLFMCHLFLEKALKAHVVEKTGEHAPPIHNLLLLAEKAGTSLEDNHAEMLRELMRFNIDARYPKDRESLRKTCGRDYTKQKLDDAKEFLKWLETGLK